MENPSARDKLDFSSWKHIFIRIYNQIFVFDRKKGRKRANRERKTQTMTMTPLPTAIRLFTWISAHAPHSEPAKTSATTNDSEFVRPPLSRRSSSASTTSTSAASSSEETELRDWDYSRRDSSTSTSSMRPTRRDAWDVEQDEVRRKLKETRKRRAEELWTEFW